jgi:hypothetical protein
MNAVRTALASGAITPGEAAAIAAVYETFVRIAGTARGHRRWRPVEARADAGRRDLS